MRYHNNAFTSTHFLNYPGPSSHTSTQSRSLAVEESAESRDRRIFGGDDDETQSAMELRGPMLDVVLGLFNGIDYDDSLC